MCHQLNHIALTEFNNHNNYNALQILILNQRLNNNALTNNNLGVFILSEGWWERRYSIGKNRYKKALKYLNSASKCKKTFSTYCSLGDLFSEIHKLKKAEDSLSNALEIKKNYTIANNLGVILYRQKKYTAAKKAFEQSLSLCNNEEEKYNILLSYAFACCASNDSKVKSLFSELANENYMNNHNPEILQLAYLVGQNDFIIQNYQRIYSVYQMESLDSKIVNQVKNQKQNVIAFRNFNYQPKYIYQCNFFECPVHGNNYSLD